MTTWISSDLHINHKMISEYCPNRQVLGSLYEMNEALIANFNERVAPEDDVIILGDMLMGDRSLTKQYVDRLNGKHKILIMGNHDRRRYCEEAFDEVVDWDIFMEDYGKPVLLIHNPDDGEKFFIEHPEYKYISTVLVGHVHQLFNHQRRNGRLYINVGVDAPGREFVPHTLQELIESSIGEEIINDTKDNR